MTPQERRGRRLFLILAGLVVLEKLAGIGFALSGGLAAVNWLGGVAKPLVIAVGLASLGWHGDNWLRRLFGVAFVFYGGMLAFVSVRVLIKLAGVTPPGAAGFFMDVVGLPIGLIGLFGLLHVSIGLLLLLSPSIREYFRYCREGPRVWIETV